jgi:hypothetical protein
MHIDMSATKLTIRYCSMVQKVKHVLPLTEEKIITNTLNMHAHPKRG